MSSPHRPLYVIGRQHSGNTMLATLLGRHPEVCAFTGEGTFFEHRATIEQMDDPRPRIVEEVADGADPPLGHDMRRQIAEHFPDEQVPSSAVDLYAAAKSVVATAAGAERWVQKATSYVFHVEDLLAALPAARLVFLVRNPLDLAASLKRRGERRRLLRMVWGWNRGVRIVQRWADDRRVLLLRYEDLVQHADERLRKVCRFADLRFDEALLEVPHVNRSETPYSRGGEEKGLDASRIHYYRDVLTPEEEVVVRAWTETTRLQSTYPDLPDAREARSGARMAATVRSLGQTLQTLVADHASMLMRDPRHVLDRIRRRIGQT